MKQIVLRVEDSAYEILRNTFTLMNGVEVEEVCDAIDITIERDRCAKYAFEVLRKEGVIRTPGDYVWVMVAMNQHVLGHDFDTFKTTRDYIEYLRFLGISVIPSKSTILRIQNIFLGKYPDWTFTDTTLPNETLRRKNIVRRFLIVYGQAKRGKLCAALAK